MMAQTKPLPRRDVRAHLRTQQRRYLELVLSQDPERRTLSQIAKDGGLNHTTLTRFFNNPDEDRLLESMTIEVVARVTGIAPPAELVSAADRQPIERHALPFTGKANDPTTVAINALIRGRNSAEALILQTRALEDLGYMPGDIVILDHTARPAIGDAVCAELSARSPHRSEAVWRVFQPPYLIGGSRDPAYRRPLLVDNDTVSIVGVVTDALRKRSSD